MDTREEQIAALKELRNLIKKKDNLIKEEKECNRRISNSYDRANAKYDYDVLPTDAESNRRYQIERRNRERINRDYENKQKILNVIMTILFLGMIAFSIYYYHVNIFPTITNKEGLYKILNYAGQIVIPLIIFVIDFFGSKIDVEGNK